MYWIDIDECQLGTDNCDAKAECTNSEGSYTCACKKGYGGDGFTCEGKKVSVSFHSCNQVTKSLNIDNNNYNNKKKNNNSINDPYKQLYKDVYIVEYT